MGLFSTGAQNEIGRAHVRTPVTTPHLVCREALRMSLLEDTKTKLQDVGAIQTAIDAGWQGVARDRFFQDFDQQIEKIIQDLQKEYEDLDHRLEELEENYFAQDNDMVAGN